MFNHLAEEERAGCFILIVFLLSCGCLRSVSLPRGAVGKSVIYDWGLSWSYSLSFRTLALNGL